MLTRRRALSLLGASGVGTAAFRHDLAANADGVGAVTPQMVADAEWVAGIKLSDQQPQLAADVLNKNHENLSKLRALKLDYSLAPPFVFTPLAGPASAPDQRGYQRKKAVDSVVSATSRPASNDELAFSSLRTLGALLRSRQVSSVELTELYLERQLALEQAPVADHELRRGNDYDLKTWRRFLYE